MTTPLKELAIAMGLLASDPSAIAPTLGAQNYVWQVASISSCKAQAKPCLLLKGKWDWKRPQSFNVYANPLGKDRYRILVDLTNDDPADDDTVCLFGLVFDGRKKLVTGVFSSPFVAHGHQEQVAYEVSVPKNAERLRLEFGTKQCDETLPKDQRTAASILKS
ncbi:hypothetical protein [Rhizobium glycinendophyticum]|uniref:Uncharacterized protein n=1 Tax=Rhizobium glycinendophyticum TaxID=2589807 RepID=A0A504TP18_9HYPH|nr:hypothetical protein [Rhizobium glycinendophyticum]TPP03699.1 hypothetical protein FJQ55_23225 [Rhizobium glycinendophyticum]